MEKPVIYIPEQIAREGIDFLLQRGFSIKTGSEIDEDTLAKEIVGCDAILLRTAHATRRVLEAAGPQLKLVARHGVGLDIIDMDAANELRIQVCNTPNSNGLSVAEHVFAGMMAAARKLYPLHEAAKRGDFFYKNHCQGIELSGKTLGLIGFGFSAENVARIAHNGFGMKVVVYNGHLAGKTIPDYVETAKWDDVFARADFLSLHIPLRPENVELIGKREFALMKPTAIFVNTARGKLVREDDLIEAIKSGEIAGAFLDVLSTEPMREDDPLLHLDHVVVTPHCGASTREALIRSAVQAAEEIDRYFHGKPLKWPVNKIEIGLN